MNSNTSMTETDQMLDLQAVQLPAIQLAGYRVYRGSNIYHRSTVVCQSVRFRESLNTIGDKAGGDKFAQSFISRFIGLKSFVPKNGLNNHFIDQLKSTRGVDLLQVFLEAILAVETSIAFVRNDLTTASYAAIEKNDNQIDLLWSSPMPELSQAVAIVALTGLIELLPDESFLAGSQPISNFDKALALLLEEAKHSRLSPSISLIKQAASKRGIPCEVLNRQCLQLGQGKRQQQIDTSMTVASSINAKQLCADNEASNFCLAALDLPVPQQLKVATLKAAREAAQQIGLPVIIKPVRGKGRTVALSSLEDIQTAFNQIHEKDSDVLLEQCVTGDRFRLLIIAGQFVAAVKLMPASITGDGKLTIASLIDDFNAQPYRDSFRGFPVKQDAELNHRLTQAGLTMADVLDEGCCVVLHDCADLSSGATTIDVTDEVHPDLREMAMRAAFGVGLDTAGIDFMTVDITQPLYKTDGAIINIDVRPELNIHISPMFGESHDVVAILLDNLFPGGVVSRIPVVAIAGDKGTGTTARTLDMILRGAGRFSALALREQAYINGDAAGLTASQQVQASQILLNDPDIDILVRAVSLRETAKSGLLLDSCAVTVVMDRAKEGEVDHFYQGFDVVQRVTTDCFVVAAGNVAVLNRITELEDRRIILVAERMNDPSLQAHINAGHEAVTTMWYENKVRIVLVSGKQILAAIPFEIANTGVGLGAKRRIKNAMLFAIAAAFGLGLSGAEIQASVTKDPEVVAEEIEH